MSKEAEEALRWPGRDPSLPHSLMPGEDSQPPWPRAMPWWEARQSPPPPSPLKISAQLSRMQPARTHIDISTGVRLHV
jgi:hypothetical protein